MRFWHYFIRGLIILPLFWNQMLRLYFDRFDKDFNDKLETICVHFKSGRNLTLFFDCVHQFRANTERPWCSPAPWHWGCPWSLAPCRSTRRRRCQFQVSVIAACSRKHRHLGQHDVEARNGRRSHLGHVWFEAWTTCLAKSVVCKLPENLMKSAWPGKLENGLFGWKHVPEKVKNRKLSNLHLIDFVIHFDCTIKW